MSAAIEAYLDRLALRGSSKHTLKAYRLDLLQAERALGLQLEQANAREVESWLASLARAGAGWATIRRKQAAVRGFFGHLVRVGQLQQDPTLNLEPPKAKDRLPVYMKPDQAASLLEALDSGVEADRQQRYQREARDAAAVGTLYFTGIRASELLGLDIERVDFAAGELRVIGKGDRERVVPMPKALAVLLQRWLAVRPGDPTRGPLLVTLWPPGQHRRLGPGGLARLFKSALARAGITGRYTPHKMRHTYATRLLAGRKVDITKIQKLLGHRKIDTTMIYAHADLGGDLRAAIEDAL